MSLRLLGLLLMLLLPVTVLAGPALLKPGEALRGRFTQERFMAGFDRPVVSSGSFLMVSGKGLLWRGETPFPITTIMTAQGILQVVDGQERMRLSADKVPILARLQQMMAGVLAGDQNVMPEDFSVREWTEGGVRGLDLAPRSVDGAQPIRSIRVTMSQFVDEVVIEKFGGDRDRITFTDQMVSAAPLTSEEAALLAFEAR